MGALLKLREGLWLLDTEQFGHPFFGGVYILQSGAEAALVETGTSLAAPLVLETLEALGICREEVRKIFLTHIHLDHGGGAGMLVRELPRAKVVVHGRGVRHLIDPSRLLASVKEAVRDRFPLYGTAEPISPDRLEPVAEERTFRVGSLEIRVIPTPGHAPHHLCYFIPETGELFTGDAAGIYLEGRLYPTTPPPSFDLEASLTSLQRLIALEPRKLLFTHFGPGEPGLLQQYAEFLRWWGEKVRVAFDHAQDEERTLAALLSDPEVERLAYHGDPEKAELMMNIRGVLQYIARRTG